jgi:hypothetical protein
MVLVMIICLYLVLCQARDALVILTSETVAVFARCAGEDVLLSVSHRSSQV